MERIIFRKGLDAQLSNVVLDVGSPGWVTDTRVLAIGDGSSNPPKVITNRSTGTYSYNSLTKLTMPGGLSFELAKPGAIGSITPARMVANNGLLAYRGLDSANQDTWGNVTLISSDATLTVTNGNGSANSLNLQLNPDSDILKNIIKNTININVNNIDGINELINNLIKAAISANDTVHYGLDVSTSANTITVSAFDNPLTSIPTGTTLAIHVANSNTGPVTANFGSQLGTTIPVVRTDGSILKQSDLVRGLTYFGMRSDGKLSILNYNPTSIPLRNNLSFYDSTTWTVPDGCYFILAKLWGAGGGGGNAGGTVPSAGSGAGGGGYSEGFFFVTPGQQIVITIGLGGTAGNSGGTTSLGSLSYASGGGGGFGGFNGLQANNSGAGGGSGGGQLNLTGVGGGLGYAVSGNGAGGIGGSSPFGGSIPSLNLGTDGNQGSFPGGGGNAGSIGNASSATGGTGAKGLIIISF